jgi:hypothetical protein
METWEAAERFLIGMPIKRKQAIDVAKLLGYRKTGAHNLQSSVIGLLQKRVRSLNVYVNKVCS